MLPLKNSEHPLSLFTFLKRRKAWTHVLINTMGSCHVSVLSDSWINCWSTETQATIICKKWPVSKCYYHSGFTDWNFSTIEFSRFPIKQWWRQELTNAVQIPQFIIEQIFPLKCWVIDWTYKQPLYSLPGALPTTPCLFIRHVLSSMEFQRLWLSVWLL